MVRACAVKYPGKHPADVVQSLRLGDGLTLKQVANHLGVSETTVSRWQGPDVRYTTLITDTFRESSRRNIGRVNEARRSQHSY